MYQQIDPQTLQALIQMSQQQQAGGAATAATSASSPTQTALAGASTIANIWSGYQADKLAQRAQELAEDREKYNRRKTEEETARATRRALKNETAGDAATAMNTLNWFGSKYQAGA